MWKDSDLVEDCKIGNVKVTTLYRGSKGNYPSDNVRSERDPMTVGKAVSVR